jgi:hypothetical protein
MYTGEEIAPDALCVLCNNVLPNSSVLPAKLRRHREYKDKDISSFKIELEALTNCHSLTLKTLKTDNEKATEVSYSVRTVLHLQEKPIQLRKP